MSQSHESIQDDEHTPARVRAVIDDCLRRRAAGEALADDALVRAHPELMPELGDELRKLRLIAAARENAARPVGAESDTLSRDDFDTGSGHLEIRCPSCHAPMKVAVDTALTDLTCGSCGTHFSLVDQSKATRVAPLLSKMGRFELIERIGVGGFGSVWKARDNELDRTVAIKIPRQGAMSGEEQEKFFREARAAAQLRHPSIVSVHEVGRDGDSVYIVSDFVRGVTLGDWLSGQRLTSREAAELTAKIADALHHAHEQGVVHRDLKPANIMMNYDGEPHLMDFGLARRDVGEVTVTLDGQIIGTPAYMSPEQAEGRAHVADRRSDVYSLGVLLFQMLTGELPFRGNARMLIKQVIHDEPPSPRRLNSNVPRDLETITLKCVSKEPTRRYATAGLVAEDLRRWLRKEPIIARPVGPIERAFRWVLNNRLATSFAVVIVGLAVGGPLIAIRQSQLLQERNAALDAQKIANKSSMRVVADSLQAQARQLCESGKLAHGMHQLARALVFAEGADEKPLADAIRYDIDSWSRYLPRIKAVLPHPGASVYAAALSAEGDTFATGGSDGTVKLWRASDGDSIEPHWKLPTGVVALAWRPIGNQLVAQCNDGALYVLSSKTTGNPAIRLQSHDAAMRYWPAMCVHPDGKTVFAPGAGDKVFSWNLETGEQNETAFDAYCCHLAITKDGNRVVAADVRRRIKVVNLNEESKVGMQIDTQDDNICAALFPDDVHFVTGYNLDGLQVWNIKTGKAVGHPLLYGGKPLACAVSRDGSRMASVGIGPHLCVWEFPSHDYNNAGEPYRIHLGVSSRVVCFGPDSSSILTGGPEHACLWELRAPSPIWSSDRLPSEAQSIDVHPSGKEVAIGRWQRDKDGQNYVYRINGETGKWIEPSYDANHHSYAFIDDVAYHPTQNRLYGVGGPQISCWNTKTGKLIGTLEGTNQTYYNSIEIHKNGKLLLAHGAATEMWDAMSEPLPKSPLFSNAWGLSAVAFHPSQMILVGVSADTTKRWKASDGSALGQPIQRPDARAISILYHPHGRSIFLGCSDEAVRQYAVDGTTTISPVIYIDATDHIHFSCSADGTLLFTKEQQETSIWHTPTGKKVGPMLRGRLARPRSDGNTYLFVREGRHVELWPMPKKVDGHEDMVRYQVEVDTGLRLSDDGDLKRLNWKDWQFLRARVVNAKSD